MTGPRIPHEVLKDATKEALVELLKEERDLIRGVLLEVLEELAVIEAIEEGRKTEKVDRQSIFEAITDPPTDTRTCAPTNPRRPRRP